MGGIGIAWGLAMFIVAVVLVAVGVVWGWAVLALVGWMFLLVGAVVYWVAVGRRDALGSDSPEETTKRRRDPLTITTESPANEAEE